MRTNKTVKEQLAKYKPSKIVKKPANPIDVQVGQRIRTMRLQRGRSQSWLAENLDLTFQQIQKYEKGMNRIAPSRLEKVAEVLDAPIEYFFGKHAASEFEGIGQALLASSEGIYIAQRWPDLTSGHRRLLRLVVAVLSRDAKETARKLDD